MNQKSENIIKQKGCNEKSRSLIDLPNNSGNVWEELACKNCIKALRIKILEKYDFRIKIIRQSALKIAPTFYHYLN